MRGGIQTKLQGGSYAQPNPPHHSPQACPCITSCTPAQCKLLLLLAHANHPVLPPTVWKRVTGATTWEPVAYSLTPHASNIQQSPRRTTKHHETWRTAETRAVPLPRQLRVEASARSAVPNVLLFHAPCSGMTELGDGLGAFPKRYSP